MSDDTLFDVDPDWKDLWQGMPEYSHEDLQPWQSVIVHFARPEDREAFAKLVGQQLHAKTKFIWHPKAEIRKASDKVFTSNGVQATPRYPIYIISKGRWESRLTAKALEWIKVSYHIVVEPQELEQYAAVIPRDKILVLPFSNLGLGGIPARNFVWEHATSTGALRHWILDDNISGWCRFQDNLKVEVDSGATFCAIEDWVDRYENVAMAAFNYDYFAPRKQGAKIRPITLNTRCYSGILLRNDLVGNDGQPFRWRGRYNEDTDLSLRLLKAGHCTALFNAFLMYKKPTLTMKGGNADELYKGSGAIETDWQAHVATCQQCAQCTDGYSSRVTPCDDGRAILSRDGRWLMAESLREQHPDCTTVERKFGSGQEGIKRWQHQVDYRAFARNELKLKEGIVITDGPNEYGMAFDAMPHGWGSMGHDARNAAWGAPTPSAAAPSPALPSPAAVPPPTAAVAPRPSGPSALAFIRGLEQPVPAAGPEAQRKAPGPGPEPAMASPQQPAKPEQPACGPAAALRDALTARGHRLLTRGGKFFISEASRLTPEDDAAIKEHRAELIALAEPWEDVPVAAEAPLRPERAEFSSQLIDENIPAREGSSPSPAPIVDDGGGVSFPAVHAAERTSSTSLFEPPRSTQTVVQFLGSEPPRVTHDHVPDEPPDLTGIDEIILNFATTGLDWRGGHRPCGVTVSTLDGKLTRFLPFAFAGGNLDEAVVKRWAQEQLRNKKITNAKIKFDAHHSREWGVDLEAQGCTFSDIQHTAALLDDHRKRFAIDELAKEYFPDVPVVARVDEGQHHSYHAEQGKERELYTARLVGRLRAAMYPEIDKQELRAVQDLEDGVIPAVVEMERNGSPIDVQLLEQYGRECTGAHDALMWEISNEAGFAFEHTASGWKRLIESLHLQVPDSFSEDVLNEIDHLLIRKGQRAAQYASLNSKIFKAYPAHIRNGVLYYNINQLASDEGGTASGRFSIGIVQQVPNEYNHHDVFGDELFPRRLFIPDRTPVDGFVPEYFEGDAAQIEFRLLVHYSENAKLLQAYRDDPWMSFHKQMQSMLVTYKPDMNYTHTKSYNFAAQYGARSIKLAIMMGFITEREGDEIRRAQRWDDQRLKLIKEIEATYEKAHPEARQLMDRASHLMKNECDAYCKRGDKLHRQYQHRGYVKTLLGRRSRCRNNYKPYIGLNRVLQGGGADIMKLKLTELHKERKRTGLIMRITNHDAVLGDVTTPETLPLVNEILNAQSYPTKVPILWECGSGPTWADCK